MNCSRGDARGARQKARRPKLAHEQPSDRNTTGVARARPPPMLPPCSPSAMPRSPRSKRPSSLQRSGGRRPACAGRKPPSANRPALTGSGQLRDPSAVGRHKRRGMAAALRAAGRHGRDRDRRRSGNRPHPPLCAMAVTGSYHFVRPVASDLSSNDRRAAFSGLAPVRSSHSSTGVSVTRPPEDRLGSCRTVRCPVSMSRTNRQRSPFEER